MRSQSGIEDQRANLCHPLTAPALPQVLAVRIDDLDHLPETTTIDASSIGIVQVSSAPPAGRGMGAPGHSDTLRAGPPEPPQVSGALWEAP